MTDDRQLPRCDRAERLIDRVVDDKVTPADREHASTCPTCGPILLRSVRFDTELTRVARDLVAERLPNGVLDDDLAPSFAGGFPSMRVAAPGLASIFAAVVILLVATSVALAPGGHGGTTPEPSTPSLGMTVPIFRTTAVLAHDLESLDYFCTSGHALPTSGPTAYPGEREGFRCLSPKSIDSAAATITPIETGDGRTVAIRVDGSLYGTETVKSEYQLAAVMGKVAFLSIADHQAAIDAAAFVEAALPRLRVAATGDDASGTFGHVKVLLRRYIAGGYLLTLTPI